MTDFGGLATGVVSLLTVIGGGIAFLVRRRDNAKDPIPKQSATLALADQSVKIAGSVLAEIRQELTDVRSKIREFETAAEKQNKRVASLEDSVETLDTALSVAVGYIGRLIAYIRGGADGPEPTIPPQLRDLVDPLLRDWGSQD